MNPVCGPFKYRRPFGIVDGARPPIEHEGHEVEKVVEHVPK